MMRPDNASPAGFSFFRALSERIKKPLQRILRNKVVRGTILPIPLPGSFFKVIHHQPCRTLCLEFAGNFAHIMHRSNKSEKVFCKARGQ
jgi:hypothetical protein